MTRGGSVAPIVLERREGYIIHYIILFWAIEPSINTNDYSARRGKKTRDSMPARPPSSPHLSHYSRVSRFRVGCNVDRIVTLMSQRGIDPALIRARSRSAGLCGRGTKRWREKNRGGRGGEKGTETEIDRQTGGYR